MSDPRATVIMNNTKEQEELEAAISELFQKQYFSLTALLQKLSQYPTLKTQPDFVANLFQNHLNLIKEMIEWTLMPNSISRRLNIKMNLYQYSFKSKQFMKDNWCFYENLYLAIYRKRISIQFLFRFLQSQFYDQETIHTALAYFAQIMVPFARYQFANSYYLTNQIDDDGIQSCRIMKILPEDFIDDILRYCHHIAIYQFLTTAVLISLEDPKDLEAPNKTIKKLFQYCQMADLFLQFQNNSELSSNSQNYDYIMRSADLLQNIATTLKQILENIEPKTSPTNRVLTIITSFLNSKLIMYSAKQLKSSRWCLNGKMLSQSKISISAEFQRNSSKKSLNSFMHSSQQYTKQNPSEPSFMSIYDSQIAETLLKILNNSIQIFIMLPKDSIAKSNTGENEQQIQEQQLKFHQENQFYIQLLDQFRIQIQFVLDNLSILNKIVYNNTIHVKHIPFSSGQDIKQISFMKYKYFNLLYHCLVILQQKDIQILEENQLQTQSFISAHSSIKQDPMQNILSEFKPKKIKKSFSILAQPFHLNVQNLHIIEIIQKYLNENRWNNLAHHMLQKICHVLIMTKYDYIKQNIAKDHNKNLTNSFLAYLIQNFTQRDYIFLDTMKFTTQGNLHSLYNIAKFLAYSLNGSNQLVILLNQFAPWKKFLMQDLKKYEEKTFPNVSLPNVQDMSEMNRRSTEKYEQIKVDEADSIRKLIQNISISKKWPRKGKSASKSQFYRKSFNDQKCYSPDYMTQSFGGRKQIRQSVDSLEMDVGKLTLSSISTHKKIMKSNNDRNSNESEEFSSTNSQIIRNRSEKRKSNMHNSEIYSAEK